MFKRYFEIAIAVAIFILCAGCYVSPEYLEQRERNRRLQDSLSTAWRTPPPRLPMPEKRPDSFRFKVDFGHGNSLDLFQNKYTHDMVADSDIVVPMSLDADERDSVYRAMRALDLFNLPRMWIPDTCPNLVSGWTLNERYSVQIDSVFRYSDFRFVPYQCANDTVRSIDELNRLIWRIIRAKPIYQTLPTPRAGYL